jgi:hypothetical protein
MLELMNLLFFFIFIIEIGQKNPVKWLLIFRGQKRESRSKLNTVFDAGNNHLSKKH